MIKLFNRVRLLRKSEHSGQFIEVAKGVCMGFAYSRGFADPTWCLFWEDKNVKEGIHFQELLPIECTMSRIVKY